MRNVDAKRYQDAQDKKNREEVNVGAAVKVVSFDPNKMIVTVQPLSKFLENGEYKSQSQILDVPVAYTKSGGFIIRPWIKEGDVGFITYVDHDIDKAVASGAECEPNTERNHSTSDAFFVGGIVPGTKPQNALPEEAFVIATEDETVYVAVFQEEIKLVIKDTVVDILPEKVSITTTDVEINASGKIKINAGGNITTAAGGNINTTASGNMTDVGAEIHHNP